MFKHLLLTVSALFTIIPAFAQAPDILGEGFDKQSPEEIERANSEIRELFKDAIDTEFVSQRAARAILRKYEHLDPNHEVPKDLLEKTLVYFDQNMSKFPNQTHITIIDFKQRSNKPRFYLINMATGTVEKYWVTHGWASDRNEDGYADYFSNVISSGTSSLGFIRTAEIYWGKFDRSVRLDGLSTTNSNIRERAVVLHGWDNAHNKPVIQGLSWGCPALDWAVKDPIIDKVANGSLMYIGVSNF